MLRQSKNILINKSAHIKKYVFLVFYSFCCFLIRSKTSICSVWLLICIYTKRWFIFMCIIRWNIFQKIQHTHTHLIIIACYLFIYFVCVLCDEMHEILEQSLFSVVSTEEITCCETKLCLLTPFFCSLILQTTTQHKILIIV